MKLLVTGGAGFIGSNFVRYWAKNHPKDEIVVLDKLTYAGNLENLADLRDNPQFRFVKGDINDYPLVRKIIDGCDVVLHLAAESHVDRSLSGPEAADEFWQTNVHGTRMLLRATTDSGLYKRPKKFIHMSTDEVFGELPLDGDSKFYRGMDLNPTQLYSITKAYAQLIAHGWNWKPVDETDPYSHGHIEDPITCVINCVNAIGPYQFPEKFIPLSITNVIEGKPIRVYGEGTNVREWIHTEDLCRGFEAVIERGRVGIEREFSYDANLPDSEFNSHRSLGGVQYLFGSGQEISNMELAKMILEKMGKPIVIKKEKDDLMDEATIHLVGDRPVHDMRYAIDFSQTTVELGWEPRYKLNEALDDTIAWYTAHREWWEPLKEGKRTVYEWEVGSAQKERG